MNFVFSFIDFHFFFSLCSSSVPFSYIFLVILFPLTLFWLPFGLQCVWESALRSMKASGRSFKFFHSFSIPFSKENVYLCFCFLTFFVPQTVIHIFFSIEDDDAVLRITHSESARDRGKRADTYHTVFEWWWWDWQKWMLLLFVEHLLLPWSNFYYIFFQFNLFCVSFWRALLWAPGTYCLKLELKLKVCDCQRLPDGIVVQDMSSVCVFE